MWPDIFGPGWMWAVLISCGVLAALIGVGASLPRQSRVRDDTDDPLQALWRRYEQGDLTRWEFERLRPARATFLPPRPPAGR